MDFTYYPSFWYARAHFARVFVGVVFLLAGAVVSRAEPIPLEVVEASFQGGDAAALSRVTDGIESGTEGWSVGPKFTEPQSLIFRCVKPVKVAELDISLFFLSGQPLASIASFELHYTSDDEPSINGKWKNLAIQSQSADVTKLARTQHQRINASRPTDSELANSPGDIYRVSALVPGGTVRGFRLRVFPLMDNQRKPYAMSWSPNHDFLLTEFRVKEHFRETTNMALYRPVSASHHVYPETTPGALTDGRPNTFTHPAATDLGEKFYFDIDLGRCADLDHINLQGRSDSFAGDRLSRVILRLYEDDPAMGGEPEWEGMDRADGSFPSPGERDIIDVGFGRGNFRGRYLRISSDSPVPMSPQLAEVEVYESRTPELVSVHADDKEIDARGELNLPSGADQLSLNFRIPQAGSPSGGLFRWRVRGVMDTWQTSQTMHVDIPCPPYGTTYFEAQALHSDRVWDSTIFSLPIIRKHFWQTLSFRIFAGVLLLLGAMSLVRYLTQRHSDRQLALANARAALAEERTRIARDLHDDLGANLARIGLLTEIAGNSLDQPDHTRLQLEKIYDTADDLTRQLRAVVWTVDPANDTLESFARYLHGHAEEYLSLAGIRCHFTSTEDMSEISLPSTIRHPLLMIAKEALHNVVKHAAATVVTFRVAVEDKKLIIEITDNGRGMPQSEHLKPGNGLANMRARAASIGASCEILAPVSGPGTVVRFILPLETEENGSIHPQAPAT